MTLKKALSDVKVSLTSVVHRRHSFVGAGLRPAPTRPITGFGRFFFGREGLDEEPVAAITLRQQALPAPPSGVRIWHGARANVGLERQMG
jgi:hypothetical protein